MSKKRLGPPIKHGATIGGGYTPEYSVWRSMKSRCLNTSNAHFADYGGRGISVCDRWLHSFVNFLADMGPRPAGVGKGGRALYSIERKNNDGDYEPGNCKWATRTEQMRNRRTARLLAANDETRTMAEWAESVGLDQEVFRKRIDVRGWTVEEALTIPLQPLGPPVFSAGKDRKSHCVNGHEYTPENSGRHASGRFCRTCSRARMREYTRAKRARGKHAPP